MTTNKQLRKLAEKAGSGDWYESGELHYHGDRSGEAHRLPSDEDRFIVAVCPATVLALLDGNEALQAECEKLRKDADRYRWIKECEPEEIDIVVENPGDDLDSIIDAAMQADNPC